MVLEACAALGVASSVCQFIQFASKLVSDTHEVYTDAEGSSIRRLELETAAETLAGLSANVASTLDEAAEGSQFTSQDQKLKQICDRIIKIAAKLLTVLDKIAISSPNRKWKTLREALSMLWNENKINELVSSLNTLRRDLDTSILILIR